MKNALLHVQRLRTLSSFCFALALISLACFFIWKSQVVTASPAKVSQSVETMVDLTHLDLEIRDTDEGRRQGLSGRASLDENTGMLFLFAKAGVYPFWMKDMNFPIDIIWIHEGRVVDVVTLAPPASLDVVPPSHVPHSVADTVLELNAGEARKMGLSPGKRIILP